MKFRVIRSGYEEVLDKTQRVRNTLDADLDISTGGVYTRHRYIVEVRETEDEEGFGDLADLKHFYTLNDPNSTPSNILTMTTHQGETWNVVIHEPMSIKPLGVMIEGLTAWHYIPITIIFLPGTQGSGS